MYNLNKVNNFLNNSNPEPLETPESNVVLNSGDVVKNILINETVKLGRLDYVTNELLNYITDSKTIKQLSYKEKQNLLKTITEIQTNSRDFIFKVAELSSKNSFLQEVLKMTQGEKEIIQSSNGETYISSIDDETRKNLSEILRDVVNERVRNS
jgi:hypothetical protein